VFFSEKTTSFPEILRSRKEIELEKSQDNYFEIPNLMRFFAN
jgi:hypothetical protein